MVSEVPSICSDSVIWCTHVYCCPPSWFEIKLELVSKRFECRVCNSNVLYRNSGSTEDASFPFQLSLDLVEFTASVAMQMEWFFFDCF